MQKSKEMVFYDFIDISYGNYSIAFYTVLHVGLSSF